jgi:hypothetical protein
MRYFWRVFFIILGAAVVLAVILVAMLVVSSHQGDLYDSRLKVAFNAATIGYAPGDPARTIVVKYDGDSLELDPDAYRTLSFYMRLGATKAFFPRATDVEKISVAICATDSADIYRISLDEAYVVFCSNGETMRMKIRGDGLWGDLVDAAMHAAEPAAVSE